MGEKLSTLGQTIARIKVHQAVEETSQTLETNYIKLLRHHEMYQKMLKFFFSILIRSYKK